MLLVGSREMESSSEKPVMATLSAEASMPNVHMTRLQ
jgi:hypothetical protein